MCGKILYVDDDALNALVTLAQDCGLLSELVSNEVKDKLKQLQNEPAQGSLFDRMQLTKKIDTKYVGRTINAEDVKKNVDTDPRIVYQHNFLEALKYICDHFNEIDLCILDRNLMFFTSGKLPEGFQTECENLKLNFSDNDFKFIKPDDQKEHLREGDYLFEVLYEKLGDRVFDRTYFLSAYPENDMRKDRHHAFLLRKFSRAHYISKDDSEKIKQMKSHFKDIMELKNYKVIQKYFADIFDVLKERDLCQYLADSISYYEGDSEDRDSLLKDYDYNAFFVNYRKIIERICAYITDDQRKEKKPFVQIDNNAVDSLRRIFQNQIQKDLKIIRDCLRNKKNYYLNIVIPDTNLDMLLNTQGHDDATKIIFANLQSRRNEYLRTPLAMLDAAYTICCDFIHEQSGNDSLQKQKEDLRQNMTDFFMCKYVYESVKIFFVWLKYFRCEPLKK